MNGRVLTFADLGLAHSNIGLFRVFLYMTLESYLYQLSLAGSLCRPSPEYNKAAGSHYISHGSRLQALPPIRVALGMRLSKHLSLGNLQYRLSGSTVHAH